VKRNVSNVPSHREHVLLTQHFHPLHPLRVERSTNAIATVAMGKAVPRLSGLCVIWVRFAMRGPCASRSVGFVRGERACEIITSCSPYIAVATANLRRSAEYAAWIPTKFARTRVQSRRDYEIARPLSKKKQRVSYVPKLIKRSARSRSNFWTDERIGFPSREYSDGASIRWREAPNVVI